MMNKSEIIELHDKPSGVSYKHRPMFVGDVYKNMFGTFGIVLRRINEDGTFKYYYKKTNNCEQELAEADLPENRAGMNDAEFVANVVQDDELMQKFINAGFIIDDGNIKETKEMANEETKVEEQVQQVAPPPPAEEPKKATKKATKTKEEPKSEETRCSCGDDCKCNSMSIYDKINAIREAWSKTDVEKEGRGRAGGGSKYDYYKPQQIIDFCLTQECKHGLFSEFNVIDNRCFYEVKDITKPRAILDGFPIYDSVQVSCPFDVPRKMAASEAQQVGAAMTYYNRRLAMMMYKIEDNSQESVKVLEDADFSAQNAPEIPAPPVVPAPPIAPPPITPVVENALPPAPQPTVQAEVSSKPVSEPDVKNEATVPPLPQSPKSDNVAGENEQKEPVVVPPAPAPSVTPPPAAPKATVPTPPPAPAKVEQPAPAAPQAETVEEVAKTGNIENLY